MLVTVCSCRQSTAPTRLQTRRLHDCRLPTADCRADRLTTDRLKTDNGHPVSGPARGDQGIAAQSRLCRRRDRDDGARHWRQHRDLQRRLRRRPAAAAVHARRRSRDCPPAAAPRRHPGAGFLGSRDGRLPAAGEDAGVHGRVPQHVVCAARARRAGTRRHRRRLVELLRSLRRQAGGGPDLPARTTIAMAPMPCSC